MRFSCQQCGSRYNVSDEKVRGKVVRTRCRKCKATITVDGTGLSVEGRKETAGPEAGRDRKARSRTGEPAERKEPPGSARKPSADAAREGEADAGATEVDRGRDELGGGWHVVVGRDQRGPLDGQEMQEAIRAGHVTPRTFVWREDLDKWRPASKVPSLLLLIAAHENSREKSQAEATEDARSTVRGTEKVSQPTASKRGTDAKRECSSGGPLDKRSSPASVAAEQQAAALAEEEELDAVFRDSSLLEGDEDHKLDSALDQPPEGSDDSGPPVSRDDESSGEGLGDLFSGSGGSDDEDPFAAALAEEAEASAPEDPFALVSGPVDPDEPPRETTKMFILASGVEKQKSPLRIGAFVLGIAGLLGGLVFLITTVGGVQLGELISLSPEREAAQPWESTSQDESFRRWLLGVGDDDEPSQLPATGLPEVKPTEREETEAEKQRREELEAEREAVDPARRDMLAEMYQQGDRTAITIRSREDRDDRGGIDASESPIEAEAIHRRIAETQSAFETCVQQELRRNPRFGGGRVEMTLTVAPSGVVVDAELSDRSLDRSEVGRCITRAARRMMLPSFAGEDPIDIVLPLVLSAGS